METEALLHFGCCNMVDPDDRRASLSLYADACGARWVSGFTASVDWLPSTLFDLLLIAELYLPFRLDSKKFHPHLKTRAEGLLSDHNQLVRRLGFSALYRTKAGREELFPLRLHQDSTA